MSREILVVGATRTAIGDFGGSLKDFPATKLGAIAIREAVARAKVDPSIVGHVVMGSVIHGEARDMYLSRVAAIDAGMPVGTPCLTVNRLCGSGLQAIVSWPKPAANEHPRLIQPRAVKVALVRAGASACDSIAERRGGHCARIGAWTWSWLARLRSSSAVRTESGPRPRAFLRPRAATWSAFAPTPAGGRRRRRDPPIRSRRACRHPSRRTGRRDERRARRATRPARRSCCR